MVEGEKALMTAVTAGVRDNLDEDMDRAGAGFRGGTRRERQGRRNQSPIPENGILSSVYRGFSAFVDGTKREILDNSRGCETPIKRFTYGQEK
jgi:hypothetical protein